MQAQIISALRAYATDIVCVCVCFPVCVKKGTVFKVNHRANGIRIARGQLKLLPQKDVFIFKYMPTQNTRQIKVCYTVFI